MTAKLRVVPLPKADFADWTEAKNFLREWEHDMSDDDELARRLAIWAREKWDDGFAEGVRAVLGDKADEALARLREKHNG